MTKLRKILATAGVALALCTAAPAVAFADPGDMCGTCDGGNNMSGGGNNMDNGGGGGGMSDGGFGNNFGG